MVKASFTKICLPTYALLIQQDFKNDVNFETEQSDEDFEQNVGFFSCNWACTIKEFNNRYVLLKSS